MSLEALASAAVRLGKASKLEDSLRDVLSKWVAKTLKPLLTAGKMSELVKSTSAGTVEMLLGSATVSDLRKLAKGLDPHNAELGAMARAAISAHIIGRVTGSIPAVPEPPRPAGRRRGTRATIADPAMIRAVSSRAERQALLESLKAPQLKSYIEAERLRPAGIPPKANKEYLVRHILDELEVAESSSPRLLEDSRYRVPVPSR